MPDISLPEVRLKDRIPEGLRDMTLDDIQRAIPDVRLPDLGRDARNATKAAGKAGKAAEKAAARAGKQAERAARDVRKAAAREAGKAGRAVGEVLPRRPGPNPVPLAIVFMIGGLVVGWVLANSPTTGPRISAWLDDLRMRFESWRGAGAEDLDDSAWDAGASQAYTEPLASPIASATYTGTLPDAETGTAVGSGESSTPTAVGADDRI